MTFWYSYDPEDRFTRHETADEARDAAEASLEYHRDRSTDGWHEDTAAIEWGLLVPYGEARECNRVETPEGDFDYTCDYQLVSARPGDPLEEVHRRLERAERERDEARAEVERFRDGCERASLVGIAMRGEIDDLRAELAEIKRLRAAKEEK